MLLKDGGDEPFRVPVLFFLITHPKGNLLYDCGQPLSAIGDERRPPFDRDFVSLMSEGDFAANRLRSSGVPAEDIDYVVISHMHSDHAGGLGSFPNATHFIQRSELEHEGSQRSIAGLRLKLQVLNGDDLCDVFGDGAAKILFTPGHTPGHQSLLLSSKLLLAGDSVCVDEILEGNAAPCSAWSFEASSSTLERIRRMRSAGAEIIAGHSSASWREMTL